MTSPTSTPDGRFSDLLTGEDIAELIAPIIPAITPREAMLLTLPAVMLGVAGLKAYAYTTDIAGSSGIAERMNRFFDGSAIFFSGDSRRGGRIMMRNLGALQRISHTTKLPGVVPYHLSIETGDLQAYDEAQNRSFAAAIAAGKYPPGTDILKLRQALELGYPDQAILDFEDAFASGDPEYWRRLRLVRIDAATDPAHEFEDGYDEGGADFYVYPQHFDHPEVTSYVAAAREILEGFSRSWLGQQLEQHPLVAAEREARRISQRTRIELHLGDEHA